MSNIGKIIRVNALPPAGEREINVIYQVAAPGAATYTDYAIDANGDLKTHAVVDGSIPVELSDDHVSISDLDLIADGITTQAEYNSVTKEKIHQKLNRPANDGNVLDYPKIVGLNDNGDVARLPAGDLGKNIANSSLTSVTGAGLTLGADWEMRTSGKNYSISGLNDVSNDLTFNTFIAQNTAGKVGKSTGKQVFLTVPTSLTEAERTAWKTAMNGGWTTNTMSVAVTYPQFIKYGEIGEKFITVLGANLNLNPASFTIEILDSTDTVMKVINNSKVSLIDSNRLNFWDNTFNTLPIGMYKLRIWNGVAYYVYSSVFEITNNIQSVDFTNNVWNFTTYNNQPYTGSSSTNAFVSISLDHSFYNTMPVNASQAMISATSQSFLTNQDNFIVDFYLSSSGTNPSNSRINVIGITENPDNLFNDMITWLGVGGSNYSIDIFQTNYGGEIHAPKSSETKLSIIKEGSNLTAIFSYGSHIQIFYGLIDITILKNLYFKVLYFKNDANSQQSGGYTYRIGNIIKLN